MKGLNILTLALHIHFLILEPTSITFPKRALGYYCTCFFMLRLKSGFVGLNEGLRISSVWLFTSKSWPLNPLSQLPPPNALRLLLDLFLVVSSVDGLHNWMSVFDSSSPGYSPPFPDTVTHLNNLSPPLSTLCYRQALNFRPSLIECAVPYTYTITFAL